jgi:hypothetical protein
MSIEFVRTDSEDEIYDVVEDGVSIGFLRRSSDNEYFPWLCQYTFRDQTYQMLGIDADETKSGVTQILLGQISIDPKNLPKLHVGDPPEPGDEITESDVVQ